MDKKTEVIHEIEKEYHIALVEKMKWASQAEAEIQNIKGAFSTWANHLREKYDIKDQDNIDEVGNILRSKDS